MKKLFNINAAGDYRKWYVDYRSSFMFIGAEFGYDSEEVLDFVHQFFLDLLEKQVDPSTIQNPKAYLTTAFRRKLIDQYRRNRRNKEVNIEIDKISISELSAQDKIELEESNQELITSIKSAFEKLPPRCKTVIDLKYYEGLNTDQIAAKTGLSKRSVYNNLYEGVKLLRSELKKNHKEETLPLSVVLSLILLSI